VPDVLFLTWSESQPSTRYRIHQYLRRLERDGISTELFPVSGLTPGRRIELLKRARRAGVVYVQKKLFNPLFLPLLATANPNVAFDFDDAAFAREPWEERPRGMAPGSPAAVRRLRTILRRARAVVAGNSFLASFARKHNRRVYVLPTPVDTSRRAAAGDGARDGLTIGWLGTSKNLYYLKLIERPLAEVCSEIPGAKLSVLSNAPFESRLLPVENVRWSQESEAEWLRSVDVGIMPLSDDDWSRGKCAFKLLQYMAAGLPTISSPVGMNAEVIRDGTNGLLAETAEAWREKLVALLRDRALREEIGARARETVERDYSLEVCLKKLEGILEELLEGTERRSGERDECRPSAS